jgi:hypothetical protein
MVSIQEYKEFWKDKKGKSGSLSPTPLSSKISAEGNAVFVQSDCRTKGKLFVRIF